MGCHCHLRDHRRKAAIWELAGMPTTRPLILFRHFPSSAPFPTSQPAAPSPNDPSKLQASGEPRDVQGLLKTETLHAYSVKDQSRRTLAHRKRPGFRTVLGSVPAVAGWQQQMLLHLPLQRLPPPPPPPRQRQHRSAAGAAKFCPGRARPSLGGASC